MVKCKAHGLHFDPEMSTGCTLCLRAAAKSVPKRPPQLVVILLCILGMASILFYIFGVQRGAAPRALDLGVATSPSLRTERIDPEAFRQPLEALEISLFQTRIDEPSDLLIVSSDVAAQAEYLSARILEAKPIDGETTADQVARFGQSVPTDQVTFNDIQLARGQWLRLRDLRLKPAPWFYQPSEEGPTVAEISASGYSDVASGLRNLLDTGAAQAQALSDPTGSGIGSDEAAETWKTFTRDWRQQLASLESRLPARPSADADGQLLAAIQDLEQALAQMRNLASESRVPSANDTRFEDAVNLALRAQQGFDAVAQ